jgi:2-hydroxyglutarate dehydrogenase
LKNTIDYECIIIGSGVVGLAIARELALNKFKSVLIIERNSSFGQETSSRNSQVIHSGIFNNINSKKFYHCIRGKKLLYNFLEEYSLEYEKTEKIIISKNSELKAFDMFVRNIELKNIPFSLISKNELSKMEPYIISDNSLLIHDSGILDSHKFMHQLYQISNLYHDYLFNSSVEDVKYYDDHFNLCIKEQNGNLEHISCKYLINSSGLSSFDIAKKLMGKQLKINSQKFYKGSYFKLSSKYKNKFNKLIYSLPSDNDSLGIHISFDSQKIPRLGPDYHEVDCSNGYNYSVNSDSKNDFFCSASEYIKDLNIDELTEDFSGIRPKLFLDERINSEYYIQEESSNNFRGMINLIGIDSPGLTSSISIAQEVFSKLKGIYK